MHVAFRRCPRHTLCVPPSVAHYHHCRDTCQESLYTNHSLSTRVFLCLPIALTLPTVAALSMPTAACVPAARYACLRLSRILCLSLLLHIWLALHLALTLYLPLASQRTIFIRHLLKVVSKLFTIYCTLSGCCRIAVVKYCVQEMGVRSEPLLAALVLTPASPCLSNCALSVLLLLQPLLPYDLWY